MTDIFDPAKRSEVMSHIRSRDTAPEKSVRSLIHSMGYRFRLNRLDLPGRPDIVLPRHKKVIFVHGCFWHHHQGCARAALPSSNRGFWEIKLSKNVARDLSVQEALRNVGWKSLVVWQCQLKDRRQLEQTLRDFLSDGSE